MANNQMPSTVENVTEQPSINQLQCGDIYIVDDEPAILLLLGSILENHGFDTFSLADGEVAFQTIKEEQPDLVLLDIVLSQDIDGYEICRRLKADESTQEIPIIFISARDQAIDKVKAFQVGGVDYITKPFQTEEVLARVRMHILQHHIQKQVKFQYEKLEKEIERRRLAESKLERSNKELERLVTIDVFSGLINRGHFNKCFEQEWKRMIREKASVALLICDIDRFEEHNRVSGTLSGDLILLKTGNVLRQIVKRSGDLVARWGEDEFIILLPRTDLNGAENLANLIQESRLGLQLDDSPLNADSSVSLSIGVACTVPVFGMAKDTLIAEASIALSKAKEKGGCIECYDVSAG